MENEWGERAPQQSSDFPDSFHRVVIKGLYVRDGKVLMCHDYVLQEPAWELPGGGLDFGESIPEALKREVREEMSLEVMSVSEKPVYIWTKRRDKVRGMEWWYGITLAYRIDIKTLDTFVPSVECREVKFFSKDDLVHAKDLTPQMQPFAQLFNPGDFV